MKLLRYGSPGHEKPDLLDQDGTIRDLSSIVPDIAGEVLSVSSFDWPRGIDPSTRIGIIGLGRRAPPLPRGFRGVAMTSWSGTELPRRRRAR